MYNSKKTTLFFISAFLLILTFSCKKSDSVFINLVTVSASVSGFVTDENDLPLKHAFVYFGDKETKTDEFGFFEVSARASKNAVVRVVHPDSLNYFSGIKSFEATEGKAAFFRVRLLKKEILVGTVSSSTGGDATMTTPYGTATVTIRANGVKLANSGASYSGNVIVSAAYIDPSDRSIISKLPGDLRGTATDGSANILTSIAMMQIELRGSANELLQLSDSATITMPIPTNYRNGLPDSIPLWYLDETNGLWKQEGVAFKNGSGNSYVGKVKHFSAWNCDFPHHGTHINCHVHDHDGHPLPNVEVEISDDDHAGAGCGHGYTDANGDIDGYAPEGSNLHLRVFPGYGCATSIYNNSFTPTTALIDISCDASSNFANLVGTIIDCNNNPVTNGRVILRKNGLLECYNATPNGSFSINTFLCNGTNTSAEIFAQDLNGHAQSSLILIPTISSGVNNIGTITACGTAMTYGNQIWSVADFGGVIFRDGTPITEITDSTSWKNATVPAWCWHDFDSTRWHEYGKKYNWYVVHDSRLLAPPGWHVPTFDEWQMYATFLGGANVAGKKMKEQGSAHWHLDNPDKAGDNSSGFRALGTGWMDENGHAQGIYNTGSFWSADEDADVTKAKGVWLYYNGTDLPSGIYNKKCGLTVRLVKDY